MFRLGVIPLFLFSGAFFPIANLDPVDGGLARLTPLWHGVDLTRMLTLGTVDVDGRCTSPTWPCCSLAG